MSANFKQVNAKQPKDLTVQNAPKFKKIASFLKEAKKKKKT